MIQITDKEKCCGCNACMVICPIQCITMPTDNEGFFYPFVDKKRCTDCGLCEEVCPILNRKRGEVKRFQEPMVFAAHNANTEVRMDSSSGGIFSALAGQMFDAGGYVGGAVYNEDLTVSHIVTNDRNKLPELRGSKYLQSYTDQLFPNIKSLLKEGQKVLVCATPCQISGLYSYLNQDYENLIACDILCRGVNSPKVFKKYMQMLEMQYGSKTEKIKFKDKATGWNHSSMRINFRNGKLYLKANHQDPFMLGFMHTGNFARPSCYACRFKGFPQKSDITLGDFWGIEKFDPSMNQDIGTSLVMINSEKGNAFFKHLGDAIVVKSFNMAQASAENPAMNKSLIPANKDREAFFEDIDHLPFEKVAKKYFPIPGLRTQLKTFKKQINKVLKQAGLMGLSLNAWYQFFYYNFLCKRVIKARKLAFFPLKYAKISISGSASLIMNGRFQMGIKQAPSTNLETKLILESGSKMIVNGNFRMFSNGSIRVVEGGILEVNNDSFINEGVQITCASRVTIGKGCSIGCDVIILDYDADTGYEGAKDIKIGDNVFIGSNVTIMKGVTIGKGAIIATGALVSEDVPAYSEVSGIPAKVINEKVFWH